MVSALEGMMTAVRTARILAIDVSNHFLAALVLEVDIDIGRLIVLA